MKNYKLHIFILILILLIPKIAHAQNIKVNIDNSNVSFSKSLGEPLIDANSRTLVPFRIVFEQFGCTVDWNQGALIASANKGTIKVQVPIGKPYIIINGKKKENDTSAQIINGRTYLPIRVALEAFGATVAWNPYTNSVIVDSSGKSIVVINPALVNMEAVIVDRVIDGDTFVLTSGEIVRMIGIDSPEVLGPYTKSEYYGEQASAYTKSALTGETVYLDKDVSNTDKYNRLLRYVYLEDGTFFNLLLVKEGYAEAVKYPIDVKNADILEAAEFKARESRKGLWN